MLVQRNDEEASAETNSQPATKTGVVLSFKRSPRVLLPPDPALMPLKYTPRERTMLHLISLATLAGMYLATFIAGRDPRLLAAVFVFNLFCSIRYTGYIHALNHAWRRTETLPWLLENLPAVISPFVMNFSGFQRIHNTHHMLEGKEGDPDNFLISGNSKLLILLKCSLTFEHWFFYSLRRGWHTPQFWLGFIMRTTIFAGLLWSCGPLAFVVGFLLAIKAGTALSFYVFSYLTHVHEGRRGTYLLPLPPVLKKLNYFLIGRYAAMAANVHTIHHEKPWISAARLEEAKQILDAKTFSFAEDS